MKDKKPRLLENKILVPFLTLASSVDLKKSKRSKKSKNVVKKKISQAFSYLINIIFIT